MKISDILFCMHSDEDLFYHLEDEHAYIRGPHGVTTPDFAMVKEMVDNKYVAVKENGRCTMLKRGKNHLKKHLGVRNI